MLSAGTRVASWARRWWPRPARRRRVLAGAGATTVLLAVVALVVPVDGWHRPAADGPSTRPQPTPTGSVRVSAGADSTRDRLLRLAGSVTARPGEGTAGLRYAHLRRWSLVSTGQPAQRPMTPVVTAIDMRRWRADDDRRCYLDVTAAVDHTLAGAAVDHVSRDAEFTHGTVQHACYGPDTAGGALGEPLSADPATLRRQIAAGNGAGPAALLPDIDQLYEYNQVPLPARRAVLALLADLDGLRLLERVTDRLGRPGTAVQLVADRVEYQLVVDPVTGVLLASQQRWTGPDDYLDVPAGLVRYYTLYLELGHWSGPLPAGVGPLPPRPVAQPVTLHRPPASAVPA